MLNRGTIRCPRMPGERPCWVLHGATGFYSNEDISGEVGILDAVTALSQEASWRRRKFWVFCSQGSAPCTLRGCL